MLARVKPGDIRGALPAAAPDDPEPFDARPRRLRARDRPGMTHWNHPGFFAYFAISGSAPGILGEFLCAALNVNAMLWRTSPAATELEEVVLDWLRQLLGLPGGLPRRHLRHGVDLDALRASPPRARPPATTCASGG